MNEVLSILKLPVVLGNLIAVVIVFRIINEKMRGWVAWKRMPLMFLGALCFIAAFSAALREPINTLYGMVTIIGMLSYSLLVLWCQSRIDRKQVESARQLCSSRRMATERVMV